jgi:predicted nuclease of predicted toxin-antitoxin system
MKRSLLVDVGIAKQVLEHLKADGYDVKTVTELENQSSEAVFKFANAEGRYIVTTDSHRNIRRTDCQWGALTLIDCEWPEQLSYIKSHLVCNDPKDAYPIVVLNSNRGSGALPTEL